MKRIVHISLIAALTILFLGLFLWNSDLTQVAAIIRTTSLPWLVTGMLVNSCALFFRTERWRTIIDRDHPPGFYATFFSNTIGYMLSTILPIRAGDFARPALLSRRTDVRLSYALGTVLTERVLDLLAILSMFLFFAVRHWNDFANVRSFFIIKSGAIGAGVILVALLSFLVCLYFFRGTVRQVHEFLGRILPKRFRESWMHFFDAFAATLDLAQHPRAFAKVLFCTAGVWTCLTTQFWFTVMALHRPLPVDSSIFVTGVTTVGLAIPTPGGVGGFHKACQLVLTNFYGFDVDSSVAVALVFHVVGTLPVLVTGLILFLREGMRWKDVVSGEP